VERVTIDTTVQPKAIAFPTDSRLYNRGREILVRLPPSTVFGCGRAIAVLASEPCAWRTAMPCTAQRPRREIRRLKTFLGRVVRDIDRKLADRAELVPHFAQPLARVARLFAQQKTDHAKLYALHAPEAQCLAKGKAHKPYGFGVKGDHRHVFISGQRRGVTATIRRELRRRSAIEPVIGHTKTDGRLDRNFLAGVRGDAINALLCGTGYNLRLILNHSGACCAT
jgi:transposase, IS5 family